MKRTLGLALALAVFPCARAVAQNTTEAPAGTGRRYPGMMLVDPTTGKATSPLSAGGAITDLNNQSYTSAGTAVASGTLPNPAAMPSGGTPRGVSYDCGASTAVNSRTTLTLSGGGTLTWAIAPNNTANQGVSATAATAVSGCTFQALY